MIPRLLKLPKEDSLFLFGPRGVGKTTLLQHSPWLENALFINLLIPSDERRFANNPEQLIEVVRALPIEVTHIVIDEVQKLPALLDVVHELIETTDKKFILTGSSARKLKHGGVNLLAGRAFVFNLHPFSYLEISDDWSLNEYLSWGSLPKVMEYRDNEKKAWYLEAYANTYLKEEIWAEHLIRDLVPFRKFLEVAAQANGKIVNFANIARDVGVSSYSIQTYFSILKDTLIGFFLEAFVHSFRKRLSKSPKFYFFDPGVVRTLAAHLSLPLQPGTSYYGEAFEHFVILQCKQLASYYHHDFRFSYLKTKDDAEIDLVVERPGKPILFIEIKSTDNVLSSHLTIFRQLVNDFGECEAVCFSCDPYAKDLDGIRVVPWAQGIKQYFGIQNK